MRTSSLIALLGLAVPAAADFDFPTFDASSLPLLRMAGKTVINTSAGRAELTQFGGSDAGTLWYRLGKQPIVEGFETTFTFQMTLQGSPADGMAFLIQNSAPNPLGSCGDAMGYGGNGNACNTGNNAEIPECVAIELDNYPNGNFGDPDANHVSLQVKQIPAYSIHDHQNSFAWGNPSVTLADGAPHVVRIVYVPGSMDVYVDDMVTPVFNAAVDLTNYMTFDQGAAYVGFGGATGGLVARHEILNWSFKEATGLDGSPDTISLNLGGSQTWQLNAGISKAGWPYLILGSGSGTSPGFPINDVVLPLVVDAYTVYSLQSANKGPFSNTVGVLDAAGKTTASLTLPGLLDPSLAGTTLHHAALGFNLIPGVSIRAEYVSNPVAVMLVP